MTRSVIALFFVLPVLAIVACNSKKDKATNNNNSTRRPAAKLDAYIVRAEAFAESIETPGTIIANEVTEIHPEVSGRVVHLNVREGQNVSRGTVLARIYDGDLQAQLRKLEAQLKIAAANENRAKQLVDIQGISRQDYDNTLLTVNNIRADMDLVRTEIARTVVRAPFNGKMGLKMISPGAYVTPATVIATINQVSTLKLDFVVPEKYTNQITPGHVVSFTVDGSDRSYAAKVMATESNVAVSNRSLTVRAAVTGATQGLIPGAFAKVHIGFSPKSNALFVPTQSVVPTARGKQVIVVNNGRALFADVETGARDSARVEITRGLKVGDTILVSGIMSTKPDASIKINRIIN